MTLISKLYLLLFIINFCYVCMLLLVVAVFCFRVNNCVSFINYKFFILFLLYAEFYCLYVAFSDLKYFIGLWAVSNPPTIIVMLIVEAGRSWNN